MKNKKNSESVVIPSEIKSKIENSVNYLKETLWDNKEFAKILLGNILLLGKEEVNLKKNIEDLMANEYKMLEQYGTFRSVLWYAVWDVWDLVEGNDTLVKNEILKNPQEEQEDYKNKFREEIKKIASDVFYVTDKPEVKLEDIILPESIKLEIKNSINDLKEWLKDDNEFLIKLIKIISNIDNGILAESMSSVVFDHYDDIIKQCAKEYKAWPEQITKVRNAVDTLSYLVSGYDKLIFDAVKDLGPNNLDEKGYALGKLARIEIGHEFNPEVNYHYEIDPILREYSEMLLAGENSGEDEF